MHQDSELGIAAHWRYKEKAKKDEGLDRKVLWLRQLLEWKEEVTHPEDIVKQFKSDAFEDRVYVFTPKGNVIDLPEGATPLDFAYAIHTEVGNRCRGAKVNRRIVPLTYALKTGEQVEVLTIKKGGPSRDWVNPHLGYLHTSRARARVLRWFKQENYEDNVSSGRSTLERELQRNVVGANTRSNKKENIAYISMTVEVSDIQKLSKVVNQISQVPNVTDIRRVTQ